MNQVRMNQAISNAREREQGDQMAGNEESSSEHDDDGTADAKGTGATVASCWTPEEFARDVDKYKEVVKADAIQRARKASKELTHELAHLASLPEDCPVELLQLAVARVGVATRGVALSGEVTEQMKKTASGLYTSLWIAMTAQINNSGSEGPKYDQRLDIRNVGVRNELVAAWKEKVAAWKPHDSENKKPSPRGHTTHE